MSTQWLADHLGSDSIVVLDATVQQSRSAEGGALWLSGLQHFLVHGHVPGAVFADVLAQFSDAGAGHAFARPSVDRFEAAAASVGVDNDTTVIVYDTDGGEWAARLWWLFRAFGHDRVAVLDGGYTKWFSEDRPVHTGAVEPREALFIGTERPEFWADQAEVEQIAAGTAPGALVFAGGDTIGGIPGSVTIAASALHDREAQRLLKPAVLRERFAAVLEAKRVVTYCAAGVAAASDALALTLLGVPSVAVYDGPLEPWVDTVGGRAI